MFIVNPFVRVHWEQRLITAFYIYNFDFNYIQELSLGIY